jgi:hypothetical protein
MIWIQDSHVAGDDRMTFSVGMMEEVMEEIQDRLCRGDSCSVVEDCGSRDYRLLMALIVDAGDDPCEFSGLITLRL